MAAWFTVYCLQPVAALTAASLRTGIEHDDYHILAESFGIDDDDAVDRAVRALRVVPAARPAGVRFRVRFGTPRPLLVHVWDSPERVATEREEAEEQFDTSTGGVPRRIRLHMDWVTAVVAVEMGWGQLDDMGIVFGCLLAEHVAATCGGLIRDPHDAWWAMKKGRAVRIPGG